MAESDQEESPEGDGPQDVSDAAEVSPEEQSGSPLKKILTFVKARKYAVLGGLGGVAALGLVIAFLLGVFSPHEENGVQLDIPAPPILYEMPKISVDLKSNLLIAPMISFVLLVEISPDSKPKLEAQMPRILDAINKYLRTQTRTDLSGAAGSEHLRHDLKTIITNAMKPDIIGEVLFKKILIR